MHADSVDQVETLRHVLREQYPTLEIPISEFTPVMGAHTGPGLLGLGYFFE